MSSTRISLVRFLASINVHRTETREMLKKFDELYPEQAAQSEPTEKLYERLADPV